MTSLPHLVTELARTRSGLVLASDLPGGVDHLARTAARRGLRSVGPGSWLADTQPMTVEAQLEVVRTLDPARAVLVGRSALWSLGFGAAPSHLTVGVPHRTRLVVRPPLVAVRLASSSLVGVREVGGIQVASFDIALIHAAAELDGPPTLRMVEQALRARRTTSERLHRSLRRGLAGSAAVREALVVVRDSSLEIEVRELAGELRQRGISGLRTEVRFTSESGASCYVDLYDERSRTAIEVDGYLSHAERSRFLADRRRDRWMFREHGVFTARVDGREVQTDVAAVADELTSLVLGRR